MAPSVAPTTAAQTTANQHIFLQAANTATSATDRDEMANLHGQQR